jgi:hypothetical protein
MLLLSIVTIAASILLSMTDLCIRLDKRGLTQAKKHYEIKQEFDIKFCSGNP